MASYNPPLKNTEYIFYVGLRDQSNTKVFKSNPTLASGDAKVSKDGGALADLDTLPAVTPASSKMVKVTLSADEMDADNVTVVLSDASGNEWCDVIVNIQTVTKQFDDLSTFDPENDTVNVGKISGDSDAADNLEAILDGTGGVDVKLKSLSVINPSGTALFVSASGGGGHGAIFSGHTSGHGIFAQGGGSGIFAAGNNNGHGIWSEGAGTGHGMLLVAGGGEGSAALKSETIDGTLDTVTNLTNPVEADVVKINGEEGLALRLQYLMVGSVPFLAAAGSSQTEVNTNLTETTNDHYNGKVLLWITGNLAGQVTEVTDYNGSSKTLTVVQMTESPEDGDIGLLI